ncbi:MAG: ABC transporter substrate-binding protein [Microbacterium sp.]
MMLKKTLGLGIAALAAVALAGCAPSDGGADDGPVKLSVLTGFTGSDRPAYEALVKEFNATHPDIEVVMDIQPWDSIAQTLPAAWASGQGPDIATPSYDPNVMFQYVKNGSALSLDDSGIDMAAFPEAVADAFTSDGTAYAVPANMADMALFYNVELLKTAGVEVPATTEELADAARTLTAADGSVTGFAIPDNGFTLGWTVLQWSNGGDILDGNSCSALESPENLEVFTTWGDLISKKKVSPAGLDAPAAENLFSTGKAAMIVGGPWLVQTFTNAGVDFGITTMPEGSAGPVTAISTVPFMVSAKSKHPEEAATFLEWWTGKTAQGQFVTDSGFPPVRTDMPDVANGNELLTPFLDGLPNGRLVLPGVAAASQITSDAYVPMLGKISRGEDPAAAAAEASQTINALTGCK